MDLVSVKKLLKKHNLRPSKRLGQNFLINRRLIRKFIEAASLKEDDFVLEVGPGLGSLTQELAQRVKMVLAVEKDQEMIEVLKETLAGLSNIEIINKDILKFDTKYKILNTKYKVVGNLPFYLTAPVIRKFLESERQPTEMVFLVQKEVGQRICAKPPRMNILAVSVQVYAEAKIISYIKKTAFWPQPKVDTAIIKITPKPGLLSAKPGLADKFFRVVKAGFSQPRKQIINNFSKSLHLSRAKVQGWLKENGIEPTQRAETLSVEDWLKLTKQL